jgi:hypothetical protein
VVEELQALHAAVRVFCTKIGMRPADLGKATQLNAQFKGLDYADVAVLVTLANSGSLRALTCLGLEGNQIGDPGMIEFSCSITSGSLRSLTFLRLDHNNISDPGMITFAEALKSPMGSIGALTSLRLGGNMIGDAGLEAFAVAIGNGSMGNLNRLFINNPSQVLKDACASRNIRLNP